MEEDEMCGICGTHERK